MEAHFREKRDSHKVKNLGLPEGTVLGALVRGDGVIIPRGDTVVEEGDHVILLTMPENMDSLESMFRKIDETQSD